jgi:hypothetical protein
MTDRNFRAEYPATVHIADFGVGRQRDRPGLNGDLTIAGAGPQFLLSQSRPSFYH